MMRRTLGGLGAVALMAFSTATAARAAGPIASISAKMDGVAGALAEEKTDAPVQTRQQAIVNDLDRLIADLEKECQACKKGVKKNNPRRGMDDSQIRSGTGGMGDLAMPAEGQKDWAKLSPRERDRIIQSMSEGFPPEYRTVLERYYRRLAEEKPARDAAAKPKEADAP